jgi:hypothetical protein
MLSGSSSRVMMLMRVSLCSRDLAAGLLASLGDLLGIEDPGEAMAVFEKLGTEEVKLAASWLATPASFRSAVEALGSLNG